MGERERVCVVNVCCLLHAPHWGPSPQPRHVPWLGIELVTAWFTAYAQSTELHQPGLLPLFWTPISDRAAVYPAKRLHVSDSIVGKGDCDSVLAGNEEVDGGLLLHFPLFFFLLPGTQMRGWFSFSRLELWIDPEIRSHVLGWCRRKRKGACVPLVTLTSPELSASWRLFHE